MRSPEIILLATLSTIAGCAAETSGDLTTTGTPSPLTCAPTAACPAVERDCLGLADNAGLTRFALRVAQVEVRGPFTVAGGLVGGIVADDVRPLDPECRLGGNGTTSWLLRFDTGAGTLELGGARRVSDAEDGYAFIDGPFGGRHVAPVSFDAHPDAEGRFAVTEGRDVVLPVVLDPLGEEVVLLPLRDARPSGVLSASQGCIGRFNAEGLQPENACQPDATHPAFLTGGTVSAMIALEEADTVVLPSFGESLCARLTGDPATYGARDAAGVLRCRRDAGAIVFRGDACTTAGGACGDAVAISADVAASSVRIAD